MEECRGVMSFEGMEYLGCIGLLELRIRASGGKDSIGYGTVIGGRSRRWIYFDMGLPCSLFGTGRVVSLWVMWVAGFIAS
jgi:hypothetical protein